MSEAAKLQEVDVGAVESAESRRKLQNRLNQRASRKRRREQQQQQQKEKNQVNKWVFYIDPRTEKQQADDKRPRQDERQQRNDSDVAAANRSLGNKTKYYDLGFPDIFLSKEHRDRAFRFFCTMTQEDRTVFFNRLHDLVSVNVAKYTLDSQLLLSVMQFNVMRATMMNAKAIGLIWEQLTEDDTISPFNSDTVCPMLFLAPYEGVTTSNASNAAAGNGNELMRLPPCLRPTALQRQVIHHPWIDLCPQPSLRDALLRRLNDIDEDEFCHHLFLQSSDADEDGMIGMRRNAQT
ncbi:hypothetical protein TRIATDRAFT_286255 [Trichoderma atroviride IMI 206040]|uniref:BZIP domain-containing protein n=1 Tax=Hypocrea atroviridis (strain ATCC 20476 / IMI 206040) TaxID=452589 RepID=G9P6I2_HYPAI|nr:uncharacterized protein TRIATDRAFT_286255 [Trichoderma atroviride IMI 206040]EHK40625.1 hypothetical protein TRIATDRAFT_286255 [Trichoderma atroviride IMI 206040]